MEALLQSHNLNLKVWNCEKSQTDILSEWKVKSGNLWSLQIGNSCQFLRTSLSQWRRYRPDLVSLSQLNLWICQKCCILMTQIKYFLVSSHYLWSHYHHFSFNEEQNSLQTQLISFLNMAQHTHHRLISADTWTHHACNRREPHLILSALWSGSLVLRHSSRLKTKAESCFTCVPAYVTSGWNDHCNRLGISSWLCSHTPAWLICIAFFLWLCLTFLIKPQNAACLIYFCPFSCPPHPSASLALFLSQLFLPPFLACRGCF